MIAAHAPRVTRDAISASSRDCVGGHVTSETSCSCGSPSRVIQLSARIILEPVDGLDGASLELIISARGAPSASTSLACVGSSSPQHSPKRSAVCHEAAELSPPTFFGGKYNHLFTQARDQ